MSQEKVTDYADSTGEKITRVFEFGVESNYDQAGRLHQEGDNPARIDTNTRRSEWYRRGLLHRDGGKPAIIDETKVLQAWYVNGELHREGGPAVDHKGVEQLWFTNGKLHRVGGPAVVKFTGRVDLPPYTEFYLDGVKQSDQVAAPVEAVKAPAKADIPTEDAKPKAPKPAKALEAPKKRRKKT